ncbi:hypothetical protein GCM10027290_30230 [Micromonospora sonneratiae]
MGTHTRTMTSPKVVDIDMSGERVSSACAVEITGSDRSVALTFAVDISGVDATGGQARSLH